MASDSARVRRYRAHQSWFREAVLSVEPGLRHGSTDVPVGSMLRADDVAANRSLNFVNDAALQAAGRRAVEVQKEGGTLEAHRLLHNLLSSMPMCFNIFGALEGVVGTTDLMRQLFNDDLVSVDEMICEVTPQLDAPLGDRTAFDAILRHQTPTGSAFVGIETKYTEPLSPKEYDNPRYREVTEASSWFLNGAADALVGSKTNQLWRGLMLASLVEEETGAAGRYAVVSTDDDQAAIDAIEKVQQWMAEPDRLTFVSVESMVATARLIGGDVAPWAELFERRYIPTAGSSGLGP